MSKHLFNKAIEILGEPAYISENSAIYNMDCVAGMQKLPSEVLEIDESPRPHKNSLAQGTVSETSSQQNPKSPD
jgi:hypothetical protein